MANKEPLVHWPPYEGEAISRLSSQYGDAQGYAVVPQVRNGTGHRATVRTADALMFQLWPSRGLSIHGIEYKRDKRDLRKELADPEKAEEIAKWCNYWSFFVPAGLCNPMELPAAWGLFEIDSAGKIHQVRKARRTKAKAPDIGFVCSIIRATMRWKPSEYHISDAYRKGKTDAETKKADHTERDSLRVDVTELRTKIRSFEHASGLSLQYKGTEEIEKLGQDVANYLRNPEQFENRLKRMRTELTAIGEQIDKVTGNGTG